MSDWLNRLVGGFYRWLRKETEVIREDDGSYVVSTPFLGLFNDVIEVCVRRKSGKILLSDDGDALNCLNLAAGEGDALRDKPRLEFLEAVLLGHGVRLDRESGELLMDANKSDFPEKMYDFVSAMLKVHGMATAISLSVRKEAKGDILEMLSKKEGAFAVVGKIVDNSLPEAESENIASMREKTVRKPVDKSITANERLYAPPPILLGDEGGGVIEKAKRKNEISLAA